MRRRHKEPRERRSGGWLPPDADGYQPAWPDATIIVETVAAACLASLIAGLIVWMLS